jgi:eukaryotic-like serine/threonine-protein kinase
MDSSSPPHLGDDVLQSLLSDSLPSTEAATVREHLQVCDHCQNRAKSLQTEVVPPTSIGETLASSRPAEPAARLSRGTTLGRYVIIGALGEGAMGEVYSAYDPELNRKVAIKLLSPRLRQGASVAMDQARLLREAQALARLSHPNVITVYDVGTFHDGIFIAMELVEGQTLKKWMHAPGRTWKEVLALFIAAGRGLAAAHAAGLIHRDFKPQNVLVGRDGRVFVTDFGLARSTNSAVENAPAPLPEDVPLTTDSAALWSPMTIAGSVMGTPGYMSPEQMRGVEVDERADQFSFCASLYEALYREPPFSGAKFAELRQKKELGEVRPPSKGSRVPLKLRRLVLRGLSPKPNDRFSSMGALLEALGRQQTRTRNLFAVGIALAAVVVPTIAYRVGNEVVSRRCDSESQRITGVWDPVTRGAVQRAFETSSRSYGRDAWTATARTLDTWTRDWASASVAACEAEQQNPRAELPRLQRACLDDRLAELTELERVLAKADAKIVSTAVAAAMSLTPLRRCAEVEWMKGAARRGMTPAQRETMRDRLAETKALLETGHYARAVEVARGTVDSARALGGRPPILSDALNYLGKAQIFSGEMKPAVASLEEADLVADVNGLDWLRADIAVAMLQAKYFLEELSEGWLWADRADARIARIGGDEGLESKVLSFRGSLRVEEGDISGSLQFLKSSLEMMRSLYGPEDPKVAVAMRDLANIEEGAGLYEEARTLAEQAASLDQRMFGKDHPATILANGIVVWTLLDVGDYDRALGLAKENLDAATREFGPEHFRVAEASKRVGVALLALDDPEGALREFERAESIYEKANGPDATSTADALHFEGMAHLAGGRLDRAAALAQKALAKIEKVKAQRDALLGPIQLLGEIDLQRKKYREASAEFTRALNVAESNVGKDGIGLAVPLTEIGEAALALRDWKMATDSLERAMKLRGSHRVAPELDARTRFLLAQVLWDPGTDRGRAVKLAQDARRGYQAGATSQRKNVARVDAWLAHRDR